MLLKFGYHYGKKMWAREGARKVLVLAVIQGGVHAI